MRPPPLYFAAGYTPSPSLWLDQHAPNGPPRHRHSEWMHCAQTHSFLPHPPFLTYPRATDVAHFYRQAPVPVVQCFSFRLIASNPFSLNFIHSTSHHFLRSHASFPLQIAFLSSSDHIPFLFRSHSFSLQIRAGDETRTWQEGKCIVFDDSWEHEVRAVGLAVGSKLV